MRRPCWFSLLLLCLTVSGCTGRGSDAAALDRRAVEAAYGLSTQTLQAVPTVTLTVRPGVFVERQHQVIVTAGSEDRRIALSTLLARLAKQSPSDPFVIEGQAPMTEAELLAPCWTLVRGRREPMPFSTEQPCALQLRTSAVSYQVEISGTAKHYVAIFHGLGPREA
jgi:hypothetical protein